MVFKYYYKIRSQLCGWGLVGTVTLWRIYALLLKLSLDDKMENSKYFTPPVVWEWLAITDLKIGWVKI